MQSDFDEKRKSRMTERGREGHIGREGAGYIIGSSLNRELGRKRARARARYKHIFFIGHQ